MSSPTFRGALIGGFVGVILHLIFQFILRNLVWIGLGAILLFVLVKCSPENPDYVKKRAILDSFDHSAVVITNVRGITRLDSEYVHAVSAVIRNGGKARLYDLYLQCEYNLRQSKGSLEPESSRQIQRINSGFHYGYLSPGATTTVSLGVNGDGYLGLADPVSFRCKPRYEVETVDLLRGQP
jgi:hypothetical protein